MRPISIRKAPLSRLRPCSAPAAALSSSSGSEGAALKARWAACRAAWGDPFDAPLDLIEELAGDAGGAASWSMEGNGDAVGDALLELCQIGQHRVKAERAKMGAQ